MLDRKITAYISPVINAFQVGWGMASLAEITDYLTEATSESVPAALILSYTKNVLKFNGKCTLICVDMHI